MTDQKNTPAWFSQGNDDLDKFFPERVPGESTGKYPAFRFWLKPQIEAKIIFLDDQAFRFHEHKLFMNGKMSHYTCLGQLGQSCPLCDAAETQPDTEITIKAKPVVAYTILDLTPYTNKQGAVVQHSKKLFVCGEQSSKKLQISRNNMIQRDVEKGISEEEHPGLVAAKFSVARTEQKSPNTGDSFEFWKRVDDFQKENGLEDITEE